MQAPSPAKSFATALAAIVVGLLFWEGVTEALIFRSSATKDVAGLGFMPTGGREVQSLEGYARTVKDSNGYRGKEPDKKPDYVLLALGDSYTEAMQVSDQQSFCGLIQKLLNDHGINAWVANAGVPGASPARYVYVAPWYKKHLNPNRVMIEINEGDFKDDLLNNSAEDHLEAAPDGYKLVHLTLTHRFAKMPFSLFRLFAGRIGGGEAAPDESKGKSGIDFKGLVRWSVENLKKAYGNPILVYVPTIDYFYVGTAAPEVEADLAAECTKDGVDFINMRADYLDYFRATQIPCHGFNNTQPGVGHINGYGHALIAQEVDRIIEAGTKAPR